MAEDTNPSAQKSFWMRPWALLLLAVVGALLLFVGITGMRIVRAAGEAPSKKADCRRPNDRAGALPGPIEAWRPAWAS